MFNPLFDPTEIPSSQIFPDVTRVTVVSHNGGREYEGWDLYKDGAQAVLQDDGKTLKIFPANPFVNCPHCDEANRVPWPSPLGDEDVCPVCYQQYFLVHEGGHWVAHLEDPLPAPKWRITGGRPSGLHRRSTGQWDLRPRWAATFPHRSDYHYEQHEFTSHAQALRYVTQRLKVAA